MKYLLLFLVSFNLFALEISILGARENFEKYSTLHLKNNSKFLCQEIKNDFDEVTEIICAFSKQPSTKFKKLQNDFFNIDYIIKKKTFFIKIKPYYKIKLYPLIFDLSKDDSIFDANVKLAKHWMIVGYKNKIPYIENRKKPDTAINFPFMMSKDKLPFVGGLDIKGNPVYIKKVQDVYDYIKIKKLYKDKKYELCLDVIDEIMSEYPDSLFTSEFLFYKIRVYSKLSQADNVLDMSKIYLKEFSSDENVPEVLSLTAKAYSMVGLNSDADYFFDRIFSEHSDSPYTKWAYIYKAEMLEGSGDEKKAVRFYKKALNETDDIELAATAAYKLAKYYDSFSNFKDSSTYIMKIIKAKPDFFMNDLVTSLELMNSFADGNYFETAAAIAQAIVDETDKNYDEYQKLLKNIGVWLAKTPKKLKALDSLNRYLKEYKYGDFEDEVKITKDALFFDTNDDNFSTKLTHYNELITSYMNDTIGNRAIYEKAKLLLAKGMFSDVLGFKESILALDDEKYSDKDNLIKESAIGLMKNSLKMKECHNVIKISSEYNITLSSEWDNGLYDCSMMAGDYLLSKKIAKRNLKTRDLDLREEWLYRYIKVDFETGNYSDVIEASKELITLIEDKKDSKYNSVYRILFDTYQRLEDEVKMVDSIVNLEKKFGFTYKDIDRYIAMLTVANRLKDDSMLIKYATEVMKIQIDSDSYPHTPYVEFTLYQAYINKEDYNKALYVIKSLNKRELKNEIRARQKYLLGTVYTKLWRKKEALKAYEEAIKADKTSSWAKLAKDAKEI